MSYMLSEARSSVNQKKAMSYLVIYNFHPFIHEFFNFALRCIDLWD